MPEVRTLKTPEAQKGKALALQNGISYAAYQYRVYHGWDPIAAGTTPVKVQSIDPEKKKLPRRITRRRSYSEIAKDNGISNSVFYARVRNGWSLSKASTTPVRKKRTKAEEIEEAVEEIAPDTNIGEPISCSELDVRPTDKTFEDVVDIAEINRENIISFTELIRIWSKLSSDQRSKLVKTVRLIATEVFGVVIDDADADTAEVES